MRAKVEADCRLMAPAALLPIVTAPADVPVLILVAKFDEVLILAVPPVTLRAKLPVGKLPVEPTTRP